jgi:hypothetical protein
MSHWAELNKDNTVLRVVVGSNSAPDEGESFVKSLGGTWVKTSYNGNIRKNFAQVGGTYSADLDAFLPPKIFESWILDEETCTWKAPVPYPEDDARSWLWDEENLSWKELNLEEGTDNGNS